MHRHLQRKNNMHIAILPETKLRHTQTNPTIEQYTPIRKDETNGLGGGLLTYIHDTIRYTDITQTTQHLIPQ